MPQLAGIVPFRAGSGVHTLLFAFVLFHLSAFRILLVIIG